MPNTRNGGSAEISDDMYLAYVHAVSVEEDAEFAEFIAEYTAPSDVSDDIRGPVTTTLRNPVRKNFRRAA